MFSTLFIHLPIDSDEVYYYLLEIKSNFMKLTSPQDLLNFDAQKRKMISAIEAEFKIIKESGIIVPEDHKKVIISIPYFNYLSGIVPAIIKEYINVGWFRVEFYLDNYGGQTPKFINIHFYKL